MEASNFSTLSVKPRIVRPSFFNNGNFFRDLTSFPCSHMSCFGMLDNLSLPSPKHYTLVLTCSFKRGTEVRFLSGRPCFNNQGGIPVCFRQASRSCLLKPCQGMSEDSEGTLSGESIINYEQILEMELQIAIKEENYAQAAKMRDGLRLLQEDSKAAVLAANARFYNSFRNGDLAAMQTLWSKGENVCVVHPGVSGISGYDLVMNSWEFVWADYEFPLKIEVKDVQAHVRGDVGYVTCVELFRTKGSNWGRQFATNVFEKIDGQWFIYIHHASHVDL